MVAAMGGQPGDNEEHITTCPDCQQDGTLLLLAVVGYQHSVPGNDGAEGGHWV